MEALILSAGLGSRLRPLTSNVPKAMVQYKEREFIDYQISALSSCGINKISIVTGYKSNKLREFLNNKFAGLNIKLFENKKFQHTNSAYSALLALKKLKPMSYIHLNCDILFSEDLLSKVIKSKHENIIAVRKDLPLKNSMENVISIKNRIINMSLRNTGLASLKAFGLAKISSEALKLNIKKYESLSEEYRRKENYYGLIRMSLGEIDYYAKEADKFSLSEVNSLLDLKNCSFKPQKRIEK